MPDLVPCLAAALPGRKRRLVLLDHLMHVEFERAASFGDGLGLLGVGRDLIAFRDRRNEARPADVGVTPLSRP